MKRCKFQQFGPKTMQISCGFDSSGPASTVMNPDEQIHWKVATFQWIVTMVTMVTQRRQKSLSAEMRRLLCVCRHTLLQKVHKQ